MLHWIFAIVGMAAVGIIVWRLLQKQEERDNPQDPDDDH